MQMLLGMILGVLITVGAAFVYDSSTGGAANGLLTVASAEGHAPMFNWDVVSHDWDGSASSWQGRSASSPENRLGGVVVQSM